MSIYTCGGIALGAGRPAEDQRGALPRGQARRLRQRPNENV